MSGQLGHAHRVEPMVKITSDEQHQMQRELLAARRALRQQLSIALENMNILMRVRHLRAQQDNHPADVEPEKKKQQNRKTRINRVITRRRSNEDGKAPTDGLPKHRGHQAADQRGLKFDPRVRYKDVDKGKSAPQSQIRDQSQ